MSYAVLSLRDSLKTKEVKTWPLQLSMCLHLIDKVAILMQSSQGQFLYSRETFTLNQTDRLSEMSLTQVLLM